MLEETVLGMMRRIHSLSKRPSTSINKKQLSPAFLISTSVEFTASLEKRVNTVRRKKKGGVHLPRLFRGWPLATIGCRLDLRIKSRTVTALPRETIPDISGCS